MEREKIIDTCSEIFSLFEPSITIDEELGLIQFLTWITKEKFDFISDLLDKSDSKLEDNAAIDVLTDGVWMPLAYTAFALGFTLGNLGEPIDPDLPKKIEAVRRIIKESGIIPYVPKARA